VDDDLGRVVAMDRRRDIRRVGENRILLADNGIVEIVVAGRRVSGRGGKNRGQRRA
jgi:hypothetical protein